MGIKLEGKSVKLDESDFLVSTKGHNTPVYDTISKTKFVSTFKRYNDRRLNDGNPLIYALKNLDDFVISEEDIARLWEDFVECAEEILTSLRFDTIIPMPSSNHLNNHIINYLRETSSFEKVKPCILDPFQKSTNAEVLETIPKFDEINLKQGHKNAYNKLIQEMLCFPEQDFSLKKIKIPLLRKYTRPLKFREDFDRGKLYHRRILFVDDVLSTGSTLLTAKKLMTEASDVKSQSFFTMFSKAFKS